VITPLYKTAVASNRIPVVANVVVSNVPGPPIPLYMAGAKMTAYYPVSIVTHGLALNITIHSYAGNLDYGLIAAKKEVPKLEKMVKAMHDAHAELMATMMPAKAAISVAKKKIVVKKVVKKVAKKVATKVAAKAAKKVARKKA
jgi:diacylglycerol O-acyltransferase / wax synthase